MSTQGKPLEGKVAIVTGASRGIGAGIAQRLASAGAHVICAARSVAHEGPGLDGKSAVDIIRQKGRKLDETSGIFTHSSADTVSRIEAAGGKATAIHLDLEKEESRIAFVDEVIKRFGRIDILVNNAGTADYYATDAMPLSVAEQQTGVYFLGPWHLTSLIIPLMKKQGAGWIVNLGSGSVKDPDKDYASYNARFGYEALYCALKIAMHRFSTGLAAELFNDNIAVNVVGPVVGCYTPGLAALELDYEIDPASDWMEPVEHIGETVVYMCSHSPKDFTGNVELSYNFLDRIGHSTMSLDGKSVHTARTPAKEAEPVG